MTAQPSLFEDEAAVALGAVARSYELPCTWTTGIPAVLTTSRLDGVWWVSVTPEGWSTLWLSVDPAAPWGPWRAMAKDLTFPTAADALAAALATEQIGPPS